MLTCCVCYGYKHMDGRARPSLTLRPKLFHFIQTAFTFIRRRTPRSGQTCTNPQEKRGESVNNSGHERHSSCKITVSPLFLFIPRAAPRDWWCLDETRTQPRRALLEGAWRSAVTSRSIKQEAVDRLIQIITSVFFVVFVGVKNSLKLRIAQYNCNY